MEKKKIFINKNLADNNFKDCVISLYNIQNSLNMTEFNEINKNQNNDFQLMFDICKSKIKQLKQFSVELSIKKQDILNHYQKLIKESEKIWILIAIQELVNFFKKRVDDEVKFNEILNKYPFLSLKILGKEWKNEYFDLYLFLLHNNNFKKCVTLMKNKGLNNNILSNSNAYKNILDQMYSINNIVNDSAYVDKMKALIFEVDKDEINNYLTNVYDLDLEINFNCHKNKIENNKNCKFWLSFNDDVKNIVKNISCININLLNDFDFYSELYFCSKFIKITNQLNKINKYIINLDNIIETKYQEFLNSQSYSIYIKNGIENIINFLNNISISKNGVINFDINKFDELREKYPELFRDYLLVKPISIQRVNTIDFWSISCFINKKYCSDYWKNNNKLNYNLIIEPLFEDKLKQYYEYKSRLIEDINKILDYDNCNEKYIIEFNNLIFSFKYSLDDDLVNKLIETIKINS
jgi:hypothetical protein